MMVDGEEYVKVQPCHRFIRKGSEYEYEYRVVSIDLEDWEGECSIGKVDVDETEKGYVWHYSTKPHVLITDGGIYGLEDYSTERLEEQAYFAASYLDENGFADLRKQ